MVELWLRSTWCRRLGLRLNRLGPCYHRALSGSTQGKQHTQTAGQGRQDVDRCVHAGLLTS